MPVHLGLISGDQMIAVADLAERFGGDVRITRQQNFIVTGVPNERSTRPSAELEEIGFSLDINPVRGGSIACTGEPHCNFSVAETKTRLGALIDHLEERFGDDIAEPAAAPRRLPARLRPALGRRPRLPGHDRQATRAATAARPTTSSSAARSAPNPQIGKSLFRRVPTEELDVAVEGLVAGWLDRRARASRSPTFCAA